MSIISNKDKNLKIYEIWHIECFEGGGANRQNYLSQIAVEYEKQSPTTLFMVRRIEADQLETALNQNTPHLISFSEQVAHIVLPHLKQFSIEYNVQNNYLESAKYNNNLMAVPFIASGYCYFSKNNAANNSAIYTANTNLHNATSLVQNLEINNGQTLTSYECYTHFINSNNIKLLGTARDLFRIKNLESLGRFNITYEPISSFTNLVQYLGKTTNNQDVENFINHLMSNNNQQKLSSLSLFSTTHLKIYTEPTYSQMEIALQTCAVPNIFNQ